MLSKKRKMSQKKSVFMVQVGPRINQIEEKSQSGPAEASQGRGDKPLRKSGNHNEKEKNILKVKLPRQKKRTLSVQEEKKGAESPRRWTESKTNPSVSRGGEKQREVVSHNSSTFLLSGAEESQPATDCAGDIFFFSEEPSNNAVDDKEKAKLTVLRTIAKMLEENQLIRQRVSTLSQTNRGCTH